MNGEKKRYAPCGNCVCVCIKSADSPVRLRECGVKRSDFAQIARTAINDGAMIVNPREVKYEDVIFILEKAF